MVRYSFTLKGRKKPWPYPVQIEEMYNITSAYSRADERALARFLYLFGARVTEALRSLAGDLQMDAWDNKECLVIHDLPTLKNKRNPTRSLVVMMKGVEREMAEELFKYADASMPDLPLFPDLTRQRAYNHLSKQTVTVKARFPDGTIGFLEDWPINLHYFRHCRAAHLVTTHRFNEIELMRFMGWSDPKLAEAYTQLDWRSFARIMTP